MPTLLRNSSKKRRNNDLIQFVTHFHMLEHPSEYRGGNQANLNGALLNALLVPAPDKTIQKKIVTRINAALSEIEAIENASKAALKDIQQLPNRILAQVFNQ